MDSGRTEGVHDDGSDDRKLCTVRKHEGGGHEQGRVRPVLFLIEEAVLGDNRGNVVGHAKIVECAQGGNGEVCRVQEVLD